MKTITAYNVDTNKNEQINENWVFGGVFVLIGKEESVMDYCKDLRREYLANHYPSDSAKIQSIKYFDDGRVVVGFGTM